MGLCFSKKHRREERPCNQVKKSSGASSKRSALVPATKKAPQAKPAAPAKKAPPKPEEPTAGTRTVFVVKAAAAAAAAEVAAEANVEMGDRASRAPAPVEETKPVVVSRVPVRTSSCTKEEVDAILIQCGRLSRSSSASGKAAASGGHQRSSSGSNRSYDFDREGRGDECDWERHGAAPSRPSPRRRTPERKRSASHERGGAGGSGSRRVSRSPGRRADAALAAASSGSGGERAARQPGKMVSVPAREKGRAPSPVKSAAGKRYPSPTLRSNSPARAAAANGNENAGVQPSHGPSLSRSPSRKAEHSPYRRNPMAELDENTLVNNHTNSNGKVHKKPTESAAVAVPQKLAERAKDQVPSCRIAKDKPEIVEAAVARDNKAPSGRMNATHSVSIVAESVSNPRAGPGGGRSSRRSSRDFDHSGNSYASLLLEDIQSYHQQTTGATAAAPAFSLPACVSKACSILEAVADLNSSSSENRSFELDRQANDKGSANGKAAAAGTLVVESEVVVRDDLMEPSLHKYVSVRDIRGETEPQESAGSNSFAGNGWASSWEPSSVDSTDRTWTASRSNNGDEAEQLSNGGTASTMEQFWQSKQEPSGGRPWAGSASNALRGRAAHRGGSSVVSARSDVRTASANSSIA